MLLAVIGTSPSLCIFRDALDCYSRSYCVPIDIHQPVDRSTSTLARIPRSSYTLVDWTKATPPRMRTPTNGTRSHLCRSPERIQISIPVDNSVQFNSQRSIPSREKPPSDMRMYIVTGSPNRVCLFRSLSESSSGSWEDSARKHQKFGRSHPLQVRLLVRICR